ncbi:MAG: DUF4012 domain-containing protein [Parcubacteria group bacterium]|nr:DUF4012 domain-containing protein [Parcubacteria group bacterium]
MPKKENKTPLKSKSLSSRKIAREAKDNLDFSITKKVIHHDDYEALVTKRGYEHRRAPRSTMPTEAPAPAQESALKAPSREKPAAPSYVLAVRHGENTRSPHVVRLLGEWEKGAQAAPKQAARKSSASRVLPDNPRWQKEVARLRSQAAETYKNAAGRVTVDLLGRKSKSKHRAKQKPVAFSEIMDRTSAGVIRAFFATIRWLFEFVLSIPLGFLLACTVLLSLIEAGNKGSKSVVRAAARFVSWAIQQAFFTLIAVAKAVLVVPIKLVTLGVAGVYRAVSALGLLAAGSGKAAAEAVINYFSVFARPPQHLYRKLAAFALIGMFVMLPVKFLETAPEKISFLRGSVLGATKEGYQNIALLDLAAARTNFEQARQSLDSLNAPLRALVEVLPAGQDGVHAIGAGDELAQAGQYLEEAARALGAGERPTETLASLSSALQAALPHLASAEAHLSAVSPNAVPEEYREKFSAASEALPRVNAAIQDTLQLTGTVSTLLGERELKRYAVLFQNNNELRPAGGFIGSLAFVDISGGQVVNIEVPGGGAYDFQGYLSEHVKAPKPLSLINARWELQDANWYPDWPTSAAKVVWFLEHAGYSTVDGVIAVQATTLEKLLAITGPVAFPEQGVTLTSENVISEIQTAVELEYDKEENKPKAYIGELLPRVLESVLASSGERALELLGLIRSEISQKNILLYFADQEANESFRARGWQPGIASASTDYLSVVHANIGGGKTDGVISESWSQEVVIDDEGRATTELTIIREHRGDLGDAFTGVNNVDYVRVYAPDGSELVSFTGTKAPASNLFETPQVYYQDDEELARIEGKVIIDEASGTRITREFGKTVFGNWLQVAPGAVVVAKIKYKLPFKIKPYDLLNPNTRTGYSLIMQKQAGARPIPYSMALRYPSNWSVSWSKAAGDGEVSVLGPGLTVFEGDLSSDTGFAVSFDD